MARKTKEKRTEDEIYRILEERAQHQIANIRKFSEFLADLKESEYGCDQLAASLACTSVDTIGQNLRFVRRLRDLTAAEVEARASSLPRNFIGKLESGCIIKHLSVYQILDVCVALQIHPRTLLRKNLVELTLAAVDANFEAWSHDTP